MSWVIQHGAEPVNPGTFDGRLWKWRLREGRRDHLLMFQVSGTAMCMSEDALPQSGQVARASAGRSEVEQVLSWGTPPDRIEVSSVGIRSWGGSKKS